MRQKISVVILTRNEENNIEECIKNIAWADEIIVMDDNSTDKTVEIARKYTDKVIISSMNRDFAKQRNLSIGHCTGDWVLQMDADERVTESLKNNIIDVLENGSEYVAFKFTRKTSFCGRFLRYGGASSHKSLRLFKRGKASFYGRDDQIKVDGAIGDWESEIEHYNFPDIEHYILTQNFYSQTDAEDMSKNIDRIPKNQLRRELTIKPIKLFFKIYLKKKGYKDGIYGLIFAMLSAWRRFLIYAKYWEINKEHYDEER